MNVDSMDLRQLLLLINPPRGERVVVRSMQGLTEAGSHATLVGVGGTRGAQIIFAFLKDGDDYPKLEI